MPSSTSSSDRSAPEGPWLATGLAALAIAALLLGGLEMLWRSHGERPSVTDDEKLWAAERSRVYGDDVIVIVGSSRALLGVSMPTLRARLPRQRPVMLAIDGTSPWLTFRSVLDDPQFHGTIVVDTYEASFEPAAWREAIRYVKTFDDGVELDKRWNTLAAAWLRGHFTVLASHLSLGHLTRTLVETEAWPKPYYQAAAADRSRAADFSAVDVEAMAAKRVKKLQATFREHPPSTPKAWLTSMKRFERSIRALKARGGDVVFVRFPTTGAHRRIDEAAYPRAKYWDVWAKQTKAHTLHFDDVEALRALDCPDGSHLDLRDSPTFTSVLIDELARLRVKRFRTRK